MKTIKRRELASKCGITKMGFTLIEMIITIMIIIILSSIAVPIYKNYVSNAKLAEGYVLLATIRDAQKQYYNEWGNFLWLDQVSGSWKGTNNEEVLGIDARGNKYFTWFFVCGTGNDSFNKLKYYFNAWAIKPAELRATNDTALAIQYNLSLGQKFVNYPANIDNSWK